VGGTCSESRAADSPNARLRPAFASGPSVELVRVVPRLSAPVSIIGPLTALHPWGGPSGPPFLLQTEASRPDSTSRASRSHCVATRINGSRTFSLDCTAASLASRARSR
jgi:hypothetical protein